jgi:hypothetical protein
VSQIFIHPKIGDAVEVAGIVVHELIHACRPDAKHGPQFKELAVRIGLEGKMTSTTIGNDLRAELVALVAEIGDYPHAELVSMGKPKQTTRMIKCQCVLCDYTVRTTAKWLEVAVPVCPVCVNDDGEPEPMQVG